MPRRIRVGPIGSLAVAVAVVLAGGLSLAPGAARPVDAAVLGVRLEAGSHTGYRFSSTGATVDRKGTSLVAPATFSADRRRSVPNRYGFWLRLTTGPLAGWEVRESMIAYVPGKVGEHVYDPPTTITFGPGRYLGYTFTSTRDLSTTRRGTTASTITALAGRRAVINGRSYVLMTTGPWRGYWIPVTSTTSRTGQRIACVVSTKVAPGSSVVLRRVATTDREIALTFDLGGRTTPALAIMKRLVIDRVCATIFPTGATATTTDGRAVLGMIKAHPELFEVGNHTQNHCNMRDGGGSIRCPSTPLTAARIRSELLDAEEVIRAQAGKGGAPYWRPPFGAYDSRVTSAAASAGFTKTVMWDIDTIDWRPVADGGPTAASMTSKVLANARTGSIVLMHLGGWNTYDALPSMVLRLRAATLEPSTISALLRPS